MRPSRSAAELIVGGGAGLGSLGRPSSGQRPLSALGGRSPGRSSSQPQLLSLQPLTKLEFGHACGDHGLFYEGNLVVKVAAQALKLGVKPGWKIHMIDGHVVQDGQEIWMRLQEAKWQWRSCYISFVTDMGMIRAERSRARALAIKAEEERVAKLPFEGSHDSTHLAQIFETFSFQGCIERSEDRAITLEQLKQVLRWSKDHCHRWRDASPAEESRTSGMKLNMDIMNTYHLHHWLIKPATKKKGCAFAEMLTAQKQTPGWCVINWWGTRLIEVVKCLEHHSTTRGLSDTCFWMAAFAVRPHQVTDDTPDPMKTRFNRALMTAHCKALIILDSKREQTGAIPTLNRLWCCHDLLLCLEHPKLTLDVVTCQGTKPAFIMKGFTDAEEVLEDGNPTSGYKAKTERERAFSLDTVEATFNIRVQTASTTNSADQTRILNMIANREPLNQSPLDEHDLYIRANKRIAGLFALTFWRRIMSSGLNDTMAHRAQVKVVEVLRNDVWRTSMDLCMAYVPQQSPEEKLSMLMKCFPPYLRELRVNIRGLDLLNESMASLAKSLPEDLEDLQIDFAQNTQIDNIGLTAFINDLPPKSRAVSLKLDGTAISNEFKERRDSLDGLRQQIVTEAAKGSVCYILNLCPSPDRTNHPVITSRTKV